MFETLNAMPVAFWLVILLLGIGFYWCVINVKRAIGIPAAAVLATVAVWYLGDTLYNDYLNWHIKIFDKWILAQAWWQVVLFLGSFLLFTPYLHQKLRLRYINYTSQVVGLYRRGIEHEGFQRGLTTIFWCVFLIWVCLIMFAAWNFEKKFFGYLFPYLFKHPGPWVTAGKATGAIDTILALAGYLQVFVGSTFGLLAVLSTNKNLRMLALLVIFLTWPYFIFDRTRKTILAIVVPPALGWLFLRLRANLVVKIAGVVVAFSIVNAWFGFVISQRSESAISDAFIQRGFDFGRSSQEKHQGLNMFEELCWIIKLTDNGLFQPNLGENYLANLANPIPRVLWPEKPTIGLDYAIARGMGGAATEAGVYATLSHGLIGQGIANFGLYLGAPFAGLIMALWACFLARVDLLGQNTGYIPLYCLGLITTFALGRDITFLDLYPFVFGYVICWLINQKYGRNRNNLRKVRWVKHRRIIKRRQPETIIDHVTPPAHRRPRGGAEHWHSH